MSDKRGFEGRLERVSKNCWRIPTSHKKGMRVEGRIFAHQKMIAEIIGDQAPEQVANVACLPGIQSASIAMPDIHWGYGFPIGGVCATDPAEGGVISPGGVGYDINCGVRLMRIGLGLEDVQPRMEELMDLLFERIPAGMGRGGRWHFDAPELRRLMTDGAGYLRDELNLATESDLEHTEAGGCLSEARPENVSERALIRGAKQCGTLGSGNHFLELQVVEEIVDVPAAEAMGLEEGMVCVMIHSGSRGLGHQVCDDALKSLRGVPARYGIQLPDQQLACAPVDSPEGEHYLGAMAAAANFAWCNRQLLMWEAREVFAEIFERPWQELGLELVYDVAHNIAKFEDHTVDGQTKRLCVHRKGATRAFPTGHPETPLAYREIGQPVIIPGDMGRASWVLVGQPGSMELAFGSCCHGAGRRMSRTKAVKHARGRRIDLELRERGVIAKSRSRRGLAEEQPDAYKDVDQVVGVVHAAGLAKKVARLRPIGVVKG